MDKILKIAGAVSDGGRLRILLMLAGGELCVCHVTEGLKLAPSTVSRHLSILERAGLIETRKAGRWVHCRLPVSPSAEAAGALDWIFSSLGKNGRKK
jgi:DNA-binding transcriptional ArsR family regulator